MNTNANLELQQSHTVFWQGSTAMLNVFEIIPYFVDGFEGTGAGKTPVEHLPDEAAESPHVRGPGMEEEGKQITLLTTTFKGACSVQFF